ncbi:hypothetical protein L9F63_001750, partial [Diploptera punctata]
LPSLILSLLKNFPSLSKSIFLVVYLMAYHFTSLVSDAVDHCYFCPAIYMSGNVP